MTDVHAPLPGRPSYVSVEGGRVNTSHPDAINVGAALRDARERRGLSLDQISRTTKISVKFLRSIENNQIDTLPELVFARGFLRAYALEVGVNPEETVRQYLRQFESASEVVETITSGTSDASREEIGKARSTSDGHETEDRRRTRVQWFVGAALIAVVVAGYTAIRWRAHGPDPPLHSADAIETGQPSPAATSTTVAAARLETGTAGSRETGSAAAIDGDVLRVEIHPQALCWVSATVDGKVVMYRLMQPGEQQTIEAHDEAVLRVGDPAALAISINGMPGRSLGPAGRAVTVHITRRNYREYLLP